MPLRLPLPPPWLLAACALLWSLFTGAGGASCAGANEPPIVEVSDVEPEPLDEPVSVGDETPEADIEAGEQEPAPLDADGAAPEAEPLEQTETPAEEILAEPGTEAPAALPAAPADVEPLKEAPPKPDQPRVPLDPASFDGVHPGTTTRAELHEKWGKPEKSQRIAGERRETYRLEKMGVVRTTISEDVVSSLAVHIDRPLPIEEIVERLGLANIEPVDVYDEQGDILGAAYPERGVLLGYLPKSRPPRVFQVVAESIDVEPFLARAEARLKDRYADCLADLDLALELSPKNPDVHRLRAELALRRGKIGDAVRSAEEAVDIEPQEPNHRLLLARTLAAAGDYSHAIGRVRGVLDDPKTDDLTAARAWCQSGDCLARGARRDFAEAIKHHQHAIRLAEPLAASKEGLIREAAKRVLLDAHLAIAYDIGWGKWQQKDRVVPKWIERAMVVADDLMRSERAGPEVRLAVYRGALAALSGAAEPPDAAMWIDGTKQLGRKLYDRAKDPEYRAHLAWQLGEALSNAVEIETVRQRPDEAHALGMLARALFEEGQTVAGELPTADYERGRLCYRIGVVHALQRGDHAQAVTWFERATPLLERPVPAAAVDSGAQGETFVSMAVSYWELEKRDEALRLTSQGLKLMESAVGDGVLDAAALAVPYNNLSAMHEALGDEEQARWCADLAARYEQAGQSTKK